MKKSIFCMGLLLMLYCLLPVKVKAEAAFGYSQVSYDDTTNTVYAFSTTVVPYIGAYHYTAYVEGYLYDQSGHLWDSGYDENYFVAEVFTIAPAVPFTQYTVYSDHYVVARFYTTVDIHECDPYCYYCYDFFLDPYCNYYCYSCYQDFWWDPWGFFYGNPGYYSPSSYFYGYGPPANLEIEYIYIGTTFDSLITPPPSLPQCGNLTLRLNAGFGSNPGAFVEGTTQNGYLGALVQLQAVVTPPTEGTYDWRAGGNAHQEGVPYLRNIYWTDEGTHSVTVIFKPSSGDCQISASVNVNEVVPSQVTLSGYQQAPRVRDDCVSGPNTFGGIAVSDGCGFDDPGASFAATAQGPASFISLPTDAGIKFVQWVSPFAIAHDPNSGYLCSTTRSTEALIDTGWFRDGFDPYNLNQAFSVFANDGTTSLGSLARPDPSYTADSPGYGIGDFDYFRSNDYFARYVVYWGGGSPSQPRASRPMAVINWSWSSEVFFSSRGVWSSYTTYPPSMPLQAIASNSMHTEPQGSVGWTSCSTSNPTPTPTPDPDPCLRKPWLCD